MNVPAWKADTTGPGEYFVCAQYSIQKSPSETKILLFAEEEDHQLLEKTIIAIIDQFKIINQDFSQLTKQPPEWDLNQLKPPKDITNNK